MRHTSLKELQTLPGIGPSLSQDLLDIGIRRVRDLAGRDPERLYRKLERLRGVPLDRCVLYAFRCAVYSATEQHPKPALLKWWNWSDGKQGAAGTRRKGRR